MDLSILEKIVLIFKTMFSSFLGIEVFILCFLLFLLLSLNISRKNKFINFAIAFVFFGFIFVLIGFNFEYAIYCLDKVLKLLMNYIYFPSPVVYFYMELFAVGILFYTIFSNKLSKFKKIVNYSFFSSFTLLFILFISLLSYNKINLLNIVDLYKDSSILSVVQGGNFLFVIWFIFTLFYNLYVYFQNKFDKKIEE